MICIAEDNEVLLQGLSRALTAHGYTVRAASTGAELLRMLQTMSEPPALLLIDLMMPEKDGVAVVQAVRDEQRWREVPILVVTAATPAELQRTGMGRDVEVLFKPFRLRDLLERVARLAG